MPNSTLNTVFQLLMQAGYSLYDVAYGAARQGAIDVLQGMLESGVFAASDDTDRDTNLFASVLPILTSGPDSAAAEKFVNDVRVSLQVVDVAVLARGFAQLQNAELVRPMIEQGVHPNTWLHTTPDRKHGYSVMTDMLVASRIDLLGTCLDALAERGETPLWCFTVHDDERGRVQRTLFERLLSAATTGEYEASLNLSTHLSDLHEQGKLPRSWRIAIGRSLVDLALTSYTPDSRTDSPPPCVPGILHGKSRDPMVMRMARLAEFDDPEDWIILLQAPTRSGEPIFGHFLAKDERRENDALAILAAAVRDGAHPDHVTVRLNSGAVRTWLGAAVAKNSPALTRALLENGADPHYRPAPERMSIAEEARLGPIDQSKQAVNAWVAKKAVDMVMQDALQPARK